MGALGQPALCLSEPRLRGRPEGSRHCPSLPLLCPGAAGIPGTRLEASLPCAGHGAAGPPGPAGLPPSDQPFLHLQFPQAHPLAMPGPGPRALAGAHVQYPGSTTHPLFLP